MSLDAYEQCSFMVQVERVEVVDQIRSADGVITQGLDLVLAHAGSLVGQGQHAEYILKVSKDGSSTTIRKRFSDFDALHSRLREAFPAGLGFDLPDKGIIRQFSDAALEDRKCGLNAYLKAMCRNEEVARHPAVVQFFAISSSGDFDHMEPISQASDFSQPPSMVTMREDSAGSQPPFQAEILRYDICSGGTGGAVNSQGLFPGLGAWVAAAGNLVGQGQFALYTVRVTCNGKVTSVQKRFSDFDALHARLLVAFPAGVPFDLPDKTTVSSLNPDFLKDRVRALNSYLKALCNSGRPAQYAGVRAFFGLGDAASWDRQHPQPSYSHAAGYQPTPVAQSSTSPQPRRPAAGDNLDDYF